MVKWQLRAALASLALITLPAQATAADSPSYCFSYTLPDSQVTPRFRDPMHYEVLEFSGQRVLLAEGLVEYGESMRLANALAVAGGVDEVWLNSPGGNAYEGIEMGRLLRKQGLVTRVRGNHACISACSYAFLGGPARIVEPRAYYGVHMFSGAGNQKRIFDQVSEIIKLVQLRSKLIEQGGDKADIDQRFTFSVGLLFRDWEQESAQMAAIRARYLIEMSLSLDFMTDAFGTESTKVCYLNPAGLARYNIANAR